MFCLVAVYVAFCRIAGFGIPCPVHSLLHFDCPGCGMSRALVALSRFDFAAAYGFNALSLTVIPVLGIVLTIEEIRYIKSGERKMAKGEIVVLCVLALITLLYGILRNLPVSAVQNIKEVLMRISHFDL